MGPVTIEGIIGDGAIWHARIECAPEASHPCPEHGEWACQRDGCTQEFDVLLSTSGLDGSECCDKCTMPLDEAAFEQWAKDEDEQRHLNGDCGGIAQGCMACDAQADAEDGR